MKSTIKRKMTDEERVIFEQQLAILDDPEKGIKFIGNPIDRIQELAVSRKVFDIEYIKNPCRAAQRKAVTIERDCLTLIDPDKLDEVAVKAALRKGFNLLKKLKVSDKIKYWVLEQNPFAIKFIQNPTEEMKEFAIRQQGQSIDSIENPSDDLKILCLKTPCPGAWVIRKMDNSPRVKKALEEFDRCNNK